MRFDPPKASALFWTQSQISHHEPVRQHRMCKAWKFNGSWWVLFTPFVDSILPPGDLRRSSSCSAKKSCSNRGVGDSGATDLETPNRAWLPWTKTHMATLRKPLHLRGIPGPPLGYAGYAGDSSGWLRTAVDLLLGARTSLSRFGAGNQLISKWGSPGDLKRLEKYGEVTWEYHLDYCWNLKWQRCHRSKMCTSIPSFLYLSEWPGGASHVAPITWWNSTSQVTPIFGAAAWSSPTFSEPHGRGYLWNEQIATRGSSLIQRQLTLYPWHSITFHNYLIPLREFLYFHGDIWGPTSARVKSYQLPKVVSGGRAPGKSSSLASSQLLVIERFHCFGAVRLEKFIFLYCVDS